MNRKPARPLTDQQAGQIAHLAKLGISITPRDAARILGLPEEALSRYLSSPAGEALWKRARSEGRAELLTVIRAQALDGDAAAQKLLVALMERDETTSLADLRAPAKEIREILNRSVATLARRAAEGEMPRVGQDGKYSVKAILQTLPLLWDRLAAARKSLDALRKQTAAGRMEESEAKRRLAEAQAKRRERENAVAEGRLVDAEAVRDEMRRLAAVVQHQIANLAEALRLKLGADDAQAETIQRAIDTFLTVVAREMAEPEVPHA